MIYLEERLTKKKIEIKYFNGTKELRKIDVGDWIDLSAAGNVNLKAGEYCLIRLGVAMKLPKGYEAIIVPRSSTFKKYHLFQTNGVGIIDGSYCVDNDEWCMPVMAVKNTVILQGDRICQFRIQKKQSQIKFIKKEHLDGKDRGGFGSTGRN